MQVGPALPTLLVVIYHIDMYQYLLNTLQVNDSVSDSVSDLVNDSVNDDRIVLLLLKCYIS